MKLYWDAVCQNCPREKDCTICMKTAELPFDIKMEVLLTNTIRRGIIQGVKHYNSDGELLTTVRAVLDTFAEEGGVTIQFPPEENEFNYAE